MFGPIWAEHRDGELRPGSWSQLDEDERRTVCRVVHAGCLVPSHLPHWLTGMTQPVGSD
jgi:hypothetical protein